MINFYFKYKYYIYFLLLVYVVLVAFKPGDFDMFLDTGNSVSERKSIYYNDYNQRNGYFYSPFFSYVSMYLNFAPRELIRFIWKGLNLIFLVLILNKIFSLLPLQKLNSINQNILIWTLLFSLVHLTNLNLGAGQMTVFMMFSMFWTVDLSEKDKPILAALLLATSVAIKTLTLLSLVYLCYRGHWKTVLITIFILIVYFTLPGIDVGWSYYMQQNKDWFAIISHSGLFKLERDIGLIFQNFHAFMLQYFSMYSSFYCENTYDLYVTYDHELLKKISVSFVLLTGFCGFLYFRRLPFTKPKNATLALMEISYLASCVPLIFPMQQKYSYLFIVPSFISIVYFVLANKEAQYQYLSHFKTNLSIIILSIVFVLCFLSTIDFDSNWGRILKDRIQEHKGVFLGGLLFWILEILISKNLYTFNTQNSNS
jgi:hypothetical protein